MLDIATHRRNPGQVSSMLSMAPTGWFQVAWSDEIAAGQVHRMHYFGQEMVAWRAQSGRLTVMDAYIWHDVHRRPPYFDAPDVFADFTGEATAADYYPQMRLDRAALRLHPQFVLENGVDFAHFTFVHKTPIVPLFTRHDFSGPVSYVDFTITFEGQDGQSIDDVNSGVEAINGGLGVAVTKSWGMVDNRTISAITPVDEATCDVRFTVYIGRPAGDSPKSDARAGEFGQVVIDQFQADIDIWSHQRYRESPALTPSEHKSFTEFRTWAAQFYPESRTV